jgi:hypothetical protein
MMKDLYMSASGSMTFLIASTGVDPDIYYDVLDSELEDGIYDKYLPHLTSYTTSKDDNVGGRPKTDNPSENTLKSQTNNGNAIPSPSDNN